VKKHCDRIVEERYSAGNNVFKFFKVHWQFFEHNALKVRNLDV